jgi:hypothetical protein
VSDLRVLFTGSRDWVNPTWIRTDLSELLWHAHQRRQRLVIVHGAHWEGVDLHVAEWCSEILTLATMATALRVEAYPANWAAFHKSAGPRRNQHMVSLGADLCLAYPKGGSYGTRGCARMAAAARIPTLVTEFHKVTGQTLAARLRAQGITLLEEP